MGVAFNDDPIRVLASWLQSDDGLEVFQMLEKKYL
jgi:hypothetical protein